MRPGRKRRDPTQYNAVEQKNRSVGDDPTPPNVGPPQIPQDAPLIAPLGGSRLMQEDTGHIRLLFPMYLDDQPSTDPRFGASNYGEQVVFNAAPRKITASGNAIAWFYSSETGVPRIFFRLKKNNVVVQEWTPICGLANQVTQMISPAGARLETLVLQTPQLPRVYRISFDTVEIVMLGAGGGTSRCNAFIFSGNASIG
jgi:hypothetical protein